VSGFLNCNKGVVIEKILGKPKLEQKIELIVNNIVETLSPEKVVLFGSIIKRAKETGFDIDIFIKLEQPAEHRVVRKLKERIDKLAGIYTVDLVFSYQASEEVLSVIEKEGVTLYEKS
jgi:predicted nucleotidyltransferase